MKKKKYRRCGVCTAYLLPDGTCKFECDPALKRPGLRRNGEAAKQRANDRRNGRVRWGT